MAAGQPDSIRRVAQRGAKLLLDQFASMAAIIERFNIYKAEVERLGRRFDPMDVGVARAFYVARDAEDKRQAVETRLAGQNRMAKVAVPPGGARTSSMLSFDYTLGAAEESALYGSPDEIAAKLAVFRAAGITHMLLNGPQGSVENLRRFASEVMPGFARERETLST